MSAFWEKFNEAEAERAAAKRERERAEKEYALLDRVGAVAAARMCCSFTYVHQDAVCPQGECRVLAEVLG